MAPPPPRSPLPPLPPHQIFGPPPPPPFHANRSMAPPPLPPRYIRPLTYSERVVAFLRQPDIITVLNTRADGGVTREMREHIRQIRSGGVSTLERLQNEDEEAYFNLTIVLSLFEVEIAHLTSATIVLPQTPPPPVRQPHLPLAPVMSNALPQVDPINHRFDGMEMYQIIDTFQQQNIYHVVLRRYGGISAYMRPLINQLSTSTTDELEQVLLVNEEMRRFLHRLRNDIIGDHRTPEQTTSGFPEAWEVQLYMSQDNVVEIMTRESPGGVGLDVDERSIASVCGSWDIDLIEFELNRTSTLRHLVERYADQIHRFASNSPPPVIRSLLNPEPEEVSHLSAPSRGHSMAGRGESEFEVKLKDLQCKLESNGYAGDNYNAHYICLCRETVLKDAYSAIMTTPALTLRQKQCYVKWGQEEGLDYGGPQREFFFKVSRHLFNPYYGLFEYTAHGSYTVQISRFSSQIDNALRWFRFAGRMIGYAIIQNQLLDVFFARHVYKSLLGLPFSVSDIESVDLVFYNSLMYVLEEDPAPLDLTFTLQEQSFGEIIEKELKPNGADIPVTEENKREYVDLMIQWKLSHGVQPQMEAMIKGMKEMIPMEFLRPFDARELEWVIAGTPEVDVDDWKRHTLYWGGYHARHPVIKWFWQLVESYTDEQKLKLLQFVTGTSSIPYNGFKGLKGSSQQLQKFTIDKLCVPTSSLPIAHTCFNRLDMPAYDSFQQLKEKLTFAVMETETFGNA